MTDVAFQHEHLPIALLYAPLSDYSKSVTHVVLCSRSYIAVNTVFVALLYRSTGAAVQNNMASDMLIGGHSRNVDSAYNSEQEQQQQGHCGGVGALEPVGSAVLENLIA